MTKLNTYSFSDVSGEITADVIHLNPNSDLFQIYTFLGRKLLPDARRAQSIIIRSEAELLGISTPRFATRVYLEGGGFINCRRLQLLGKSAAGRQADEHGSRYADGTIPEHCRNGELNPIEHPMPSLDELLKGQPCVADCVLSEPQRLTIRQFYYVDIVPARLLSIFGEPRVDHAAPGPYTPYVRSIEFGGGFCAQAVCFMATIALSSYARILCGLAEITAYAHSDSCRELTLSGLTAEKMQQYFSRVGLKMTEQAPSQCCRPLLSDSERREMATALRCYLQSNMPVIFPVDGHKMTSVPSAKDSIYSKNAYSISPRLIEENSPHAIILMGYSLKEDEFAFHDPFVLPYMVASALELGRVGCQRDGTIKIADNGVFMPVTPEAVRLPLLWERVQDQQGQVQVRAGLFTISKTLHVLLHNLTRPNAFSFAYRAPFLLSCLPPGAEELIGIDPAHQMLIAKEIEDCLNALHESHCWKKPRWVWFELHANSVWIWDAELAPVDGMPATLLDCLKYLLAVTRLNPAKGGMSPDTVYFTPDE